MKIKSITSDQVQVEIDDLNYVTIKYLEEQDEVTIQTVSWAERMIDRPRSSQVDEAILFGFRELVKSLSVTIKNLKNL